jgi:hypothetical protein
MPNTLCQPTIIREVLVVQSRVIKEMIKDFLIQAACQAA